jgi:hypothetical protein
MLPRVVLLGVAGAAVVVVRDARRARADPAESRPSVSPD